MDSITYPIFSFGFLRAYVITMRPYLLFVSGAAGMVGLAFIGEPPAIRVILAFIPLFLSYGFGQALTDCFQTDTDAISSPYRPLVRGIVSRKQVVGFSICGLVMSALILAYLNPVILIFGMLSIIGLISYTPFKRTWWGGPPWNSWIVAVLPIMGRLVDRDYRIGTFFAVGDSNSVTFLLAVLAIFFGYANFVVMGYFKDISADSKTGYRTFPVTFGWQPAAVYSDLTAVAAAVLTFSVLLRVGGVDIIGFAIFAAALSVNIYAQIKIHLTRDEGKTHGPIANVVRAFVLYCISMVVALQPGWMVFVVAYYLSFELTLRLRPERTQV